MRSGNGSVDVMTTLRPGLPGVRIPTAEAGFFSSRERPHQSQRIHSTRHTEQQRETETHLHIWPRPRINGALPPLPVYASMEWTGNLQRFDPLLVM